eukprot:665461-Rhodomonas_salina.1
MLHSLCCPDTRLEICMLVCVLAHRVFDLGRALTQACLCADGAASEHMCPAVPSAGIGSCACAVRWIQVALACACVHADATVWFGGAQDARASRQNRSL